MTEEWHKDPDHRLQCHKRMSEEVKRRFPGRNIGGVNEDKPPDLLTGLTVQHSENRKALLTTDISGIPVTILCSYSINSAISNECCYETAMSIVRMTGKVFWNL
jgi:hypothetical protein